MQTHLEWKKKTMKKSSKDAGRDLPPFDNRPCFSIITPHESSQRLEIPPDFVRNHLPKPIPSKAVVKDHSGDSWNISISKEHKKTIMEHGWDQFYKDHCIKEKEILLFKYNGDMCFNVQIFDQSVREREFVSISPRHQATPQVKEEEMDIDDDVVEIEYSNVQIANKTKIKTTAGQNPDQARVKKHNPSCFLTNLPQSNGGGGRGKYGKLMEQSMEENKEKMQKLGISDLSRKKFKSSPPPKILRKDISSSDGKTQTQLPLRHPSSSWLKPTAPVSSHGERVCDPKTCHKCRNLKSNKKSSKSTAGRDLPPIDNRPCFYIILHPMTPEEASQSLEIPPDFVRNNLPNPIPSKAVLKDHSGDCWNISIISKKRNKTIMKHGWNRFYKDHCIRDKEFLFFRYNGDMSFNVQIFDISGRERKYVSTSRRAHQATPEADEEEEIESLVLANKAKTRVKNCKAAQDFKYNSKFPHFKHCLTKSNVEDPFLLNIPRCFCAHIPQGRADFTLHTSKGKSWEVTSIQNGTSRKFSKGWVRFAKDNKLNILDTCVFQLVAPTKFRVHIFKQQS